MAIGDRGHRPTIGETPTIHPRAARLSFGRNEPLPQGPFRVVWTSLFVALKGDQRETATPFWRAPPKNRHTNPNAVAAGG